MGVAAGLPRRARLDSFLRDLDDLPPAVLAAMGARAVALCRLAARRTGDELRHHEGVVRPALVALLTRRSSLRYGHPVLRRGSALERPQRLETRIDPLLATAACSGVQVCAAVRTEPAAIVATKRSRRQREDHRFANERSEIDLVAMIEAE